MQKGEERECQSEARLLLSGVSGSPAPLPQMLRRLPLISLTCAVSQTPSSSRSAAILAKMMSTKVEKCADVSASGYDAVVVVAPNVSVAPEAVSSILIYPTFSLSNS